MPESVSGFSAAAWVYQVLTEDSDRTVLIADGKQVTAAALADEVWKLRAALSQANIGVDHIVAVSCERSVASLATVLACFCEGAVPLLADPRQDHDVLTKLFDALRIHGLFCGSSLDSSAFTARLPYLKWTGDSSLSKKHILPEVNGEGAFILHSSGTCGLPRAIHHAGGAINWQAKALISNLRMKTGIELWFTGTFASPAVFAVGICATLAAGGTLTLDDPEIALASAQRRAEVQRVLLMSQSADHELWNAERLLGLKGKVSSVFMTDRSPHEHYATTVRNATDASLWCGLSFAECAGFLTVNLVPGVWPMESVGRPIGGAEIKITGTDSVQLGPGKIGKLSYIGAPVPTKVTALTFQPRDGTTQLSSTGDWAILDENDYLYILGCEKAAFYKAGFLVKAIPVELGLSSLPDVSDAVVFPVSNDEVENEVAVAIVPKNEIGDYSASIATLSESHPRFTLPERVVIVSSISRTPSGKIKRFGYFAPSRGTSIHAKESPTEVTKPNVN